EQHKHGYTVRSTGCGCGWRRYCYSKGWRQEVDPDPAASSAKSLRRVSSLESGVVSLRPVPWEVGKTLRGDQEPRLWPERADIAQRGVHSGQSSSGLANPAA